MLEVSFFCIILFVFLNIITMIRRIPIFAIILAVFTIWFTVFYIFPDTTLLSLNIPLTIFTILVSVVNIIVNALELNEE